MKRVKQLMAVAAVVMAGVALAAPAATAAPQPQDVGIMGACGDGFNPQNIANWASVRASVPMGVSGKVVELRGTAGYDGPQIACGWSRMVGGTLKGSRVWVDRSFDGGRTFQAWQQFWTIPSQNGRNYTLGVNPSNAVLRACGDFGRAPAYCTGWRAIP